MFSYAENTLKGIALYGYFPEFDNYGNKTEKYEKKENFDIEMTVISIKKSEIYHFDGTQFYVKSNNANCIFKVKKNIKKDLQLDNVPVLTEDILNSKINAINRQLDTIYDPWLKILKSSEIEQQRKDSITNAQDKAKAEQLQKDSIKMYNSYVSNKKNWKKIYNDFGPLNCSLCNCFHYSVDSIYALTPDSVWYYHKSEKFEDIELKYIHSSKIESPLHFGAFYNACKDSIEKKKSPNNLEVTSINKKSKENFDNNIQEKYPNGILHDYGFNLNSAAGIEPFFRYTNTNKKTIKYIDFFFYIKNPVNDICKIKHQTENVAEVSCVGPIEFKQTSTYKWDHASHWTSYDASLMVLVKAKITFMDKTTVIIPANKLIK